MAALPYMPLYVADYLADAAHLTTIEHGAYLLLIMNYWQRGEALPNDDARLARIVRMTKREWARHREALSEFFEIDGTRWKHGRIAAELARVEAKSLKCKRAGQASVKRKLNERSTDAEQTLNHTDTDTSSSVSNDTGGEPPVDPLKEIFDIGVALLTSSGQTEKQARTLIGKWRKEKGEAKVLPALLDCRNRAISNPVEWLEKRFQGGRYVSASGYEYRGDDESVLRQAEKRADWNTYWAIKGGKAA